jgi:hypothetical protein
MTKVKSQVTDQNRREDKPAGLLIGARDSAYKEMNECMVPYIIQ